MVISSDSLFVRGQIEEGEKFFIIAQCDLDLPTKKKISLNYVSLNHDGLLTFSPTPNMTLEPMYFTHQMKNNKTILYHKNKKVNKNNIDIAPTRIVEKNNIFSGVWYYLSIPDAEIPWLFENPILKTEILKSNINGYYQNISSQTFKKFTPNRTTVFSFIPKKYFTINNEKKRGYPSYLEWLQSGITTPGTTKNDGTPQFSYPMRRGNIPVAGKIISPQPPKEIRKRPPGKNYSFTELLQEEKDKKKIPPKKVEEPKTSNKFYIIISIIIIIIVSILGYFNFFYFKNPTETLPVKEIKKEYRPVIIPLP